MNEPGQRFRDLREKLDILTEWESPILWAEIQVSRQFTLHVVQLPDGSPPTWHRWFEQAIGHIENAGHDRLTLVVNDTQYHLSLIRGDT